METTIDVQSVYESAGPCREVLGLIANKWTSLVVGVLRRRPHRFGELRRAVGISQKVLSQNLRALERDGLVRRTVHPTKPPSVEYAMTPLGMGVVAHLVALNEWAEANYTLICAAREEFDVRA
ncbi:MAG: helix-turn-helix domain-containing protein [Kibdelosporangium sp.]